MNTKTIPFMKYRHFASAVSVLMIVIAVSAIALRGLNFGLDFTGGSSIELRYEKSADLPALRQQLAELGHPGAVVLYFGSDRDVQIRFQSANSTEGDTVSAALANESSGIEVERISYVGPQVGDELTTDGGLGMLAALVLVMIYVAMRFQYKFALGAVLALVHDVIIVLGVFALFQLDFDLTVLAAVLAVIGYSLNDTIVVYDRVRENFRLMRKSLPMEIIDSAMTQTLGRSVMTSATTILVVLALFFVGGEVIHNFALALLVGIGVGTYSSIYIASNLLVILNISREDLIPVVVEREGEHFDELP